MLLPVLASCHVRAAGGSGPRIPAGRGFHRGYLLDAMQRAGSCRGFGVFAAAADKAGQGGTGLRIRQDVMGDHRSLHVLVAEPRLLLVNGDTTVGMSWARQHARRSADTGMVAPLHGAHPERMSRLIAVGGAQRRQ